MTKAMQEQNLRYRRLFETAFDGILILDFETGKIEDVNPYLIQMLGYSKEEIIGMELWEIGAMVDKMPPSALLQHSRKTATSNTAIYHCAPRPAKSSTSSSSAMPMA